MGPEWAATLAHQFRCLGGRWETQCAVEALSECRFLLTLSSPCAGDRMMHLLQSLNILFPGSGFSLHLRCALWAPPPDVPDPLRGAAGAETRDQTSAESDEEKQRSLSEIAQFLKPVGGR